MSACVRTRRSRRWCTVLAMAVFCLGPRLSAGVSLPPVPDRYPDVAAAYWVEVNGRPLWAGRPDTRLPQASLAKLMTALLVVEAGRLDATVVVSQAAANETGSRLGLRRGERVSRAMLLAAALVRSANDACRALADDAAGNQPAFVARMNARARALALANTHFSNACGHDAGDQYSSAHDLALLARVVMRQRAIADLVGMQRTTVSTRGGRSFVVRNTNALIGQLPGAYGLKTGYTPGAGRCLVALVRRDDLDVLVVLLHSPDRWWDAASLVELAFDAAPRRS